MSQQNQANHGFKTDTDAETFLNRKAWHFECSKLGMPEAADVRAGGTTSEMHESRKQVRRVLNAMSATEKYGQIDEGMARASTYGANVIGRIEGMLDSDIHRNGSSSSSADWRDSTGKPIKPMRNMDDFKSHYRAAHRNGQDDITLVDWFRGVANMPTSLAVKNALTEGTNSQGGFTVPSVVMPQILGALVPNSSLLQAGMPILPLDSGAKTYTTAIVSGIPSAAWRLESGTVAESDPVFSGVVATPQSLSFFFKISRELLADSQNIEGALLAAIGQSMAKALDLAGLRGSGTAPTPRGILNTAGIQTVTNGANGAALASYANLFSAVQALLQADAPMPNAAIMSPRSLVKLGGLLDTTNQPLRVPMMLEGVQLLGTSQIPNNLTVGASTDCSEMYLGDFSKMAMMLRESLSVQLLSELYAGTGQLAFMCHCRADFAVMYPSAFALVTGVRP